MVWEVLSGARRHLDFQGCPNDEHTPQKSVGLEREVDVDASRLARTDFNQRAKVARELTVMEAEAKQTRHLNVEVVVHHGRSTTVGHERHSLSPSLRASFP